MVENAGTSALAYFWSEATTWHDAHHRRARRSPLAASAKAESSVNQTAIGAASLAAKMRNLRFMLSIPLKSGRFAAPRPAFFCPGQEEQTAISPTAQAMIFALVQRIRLHFVVHRFASFIEGITNDAHCLCIKGSVEDFKVFDRDEEWKKWGHCDAPGCRTGGSTSLSHHQPSTIIALQTWEGCSIFSHKPSVRGAPRRTKEAKRVFGGHSTHRLAEARGDAHHPWPKRVSGKIILII
jgi:hypothetical protein